MSLEEITIKHEISSCHGGDEESQIIFFAYPESGETQIVVRKTYSQRFNLQEYSEAMKLFNEINGSGKIVDLELISDIVTHRIRVD